MAYQTWIIIKPLYFLVNKPSPFLEITILIKVENLRLWGVNTQNKQFLENGKAEKRKRIDFFFFKLI